MSAFGDQECLQLSGEERLAGEGLAYEEDDGRAVPVAARARFRLYFPLHPCEVPCPGSGSEGFLLVGYRSRHDPPSGDIGPVHQDKSPRRLTRTVEVEPRNLMRFFEDESCGQCTPCRNGTEKAVKLMSADTWDSALLEELATTMRDDSICGLVQAAPNPLTSLLKIFPEDVR